MSPRSIEAFGPIVPVLVDQDLQVIAGHGRVLAAHRMGLKELPTICIDHLSDLQIRAFSIADNKLTENSTWNETLLGQQLKALADVELDFSIEATGFEMGEIDVIIEGLEPANDGAADSADSISDSQTVPVSRIGDLWELDRNRVLCGNALDEEMYFRLMEKRKAELIYIGTQLSNL